MRLHPSMSARVRNGIVLALVLALPAALLALAAEATASRLAAQA
jgi:hypothetical protein